MVQQYVSAAQSIDDDVKTTSAAVLPKSEIGLSEELSRVDNTIAAQKNILVQLDGDAMNTFYDNYKNNITSIIEAKKMILNIDCSKDADASFAGYFRQYNSALSTL